MAQNRSELLLPFATAILGLLQPNEDKQDRKNLRLARRMYKKLKKEWSKDGLDEDEKKILRGMKFKLAERTMELGQ